MLRCRKLKPATRKLYSQSAASFCKRTEIAQKKKAPANLDDVINEDLVNQFLEGRTATDILITFYFVKWVFNLDKSTLPASYQSPLGSIQNQKTSYQTLERRCGCRR